MRVARLLSVCLAVLVAALVVAPGAAAETPFRLPGYVTDRADALTPATSATVTSAIDRLYTDQTIRLWVVYVDDFSGQDAESWAKSTIRISDLQNTDAVLAVATVDRAYAFLVPNGLNGITASQVNDLRRNKIEPALRNSDWSGAAVAAAQGLDTWKSEGGGVSWLAFGIALAIIVLLVVVLLLVMRRRRRRRREAELAAARRVDPVDPRALASVPMEALEDLSKSIVVDVDNAVRSSENELALAVEEFGAQRTDPFTRAIANARLTLAQAFNVRQQLDDAVPENPMQRRDLLTRVIVAAARADRELDAQAEAFHRLRDMVINAPAKLDTLTQQLVEVTARIEPSQQKLAALHGEFAVTALVSVADNVNHAKERLGFADQNMTRARELAQRAVAGQQAELVDCVRSAEAALAQAQSMLDAVDGAASDIRRAAGTLPSVIADIQAGITQADTMLRQGNAPRGADLAAARSAAAQALDSAQKDGSADPLGAFTALTKADAELDRILRTAQQDREAAERLGRAYDQALFTAQSRVKAVSDYIDTRRGSVGPEARTRLAEAMRHVEAAQAKRQNNIDEAIKHANGASMLAAQAQQLANADVAAAQRSYSSWGGGGGGGSNVGAVIGGIVLGNILSGAMRGGGFGGGWGGSGSSWGGSGSSWGGGGGGGGGGGFMGGGGRF